MSVIYPEITKLGTILAIWAHPDDESWCAGGVLAAAADNEQRVVCVTATRGQAGEQNDESLGDEPMGTIRERELQNAMKELGVTEHIWLDYVDGACHEVNQHEAISKLIPIIKDVQPDSILTFGPDGLTGHLDHQAVSHWTDGALAHAKLTPKVFHKVESKEYYGRLGKKVDEKFNIYYMTDQPPLVAEAECDLAFRLSPELIQRKLAALRAQSSQMKQIFDGLTQAELEDLVSFEGFQAA